MDSGEVMTDNVKMRLYVTVIVIAMAILYVGPPNIINHSNSVRQEFINSCTTDFGFGFDYCMGQADQEEAAAIPLWEYLLPYLPATALLWLNWLLKPKQRLSDN